MFGAAYSAYALPEYVSALLEAVLCEIDRVYHNVNQEEWNRYDDPGVPGVTFHSYYWDRCNCGYDDAYGKWIDEHPHSKDCFYSKCLSVIGCSYLSPSKIDSHEFELLKLCEEHGVEYSNGYGLATCTCNQDNERLAWVDTHYYDPTCGVVRPNFSYQGVEIRWYKHPGRGMSSNVEMTPATL